MLFSEDRKFVFVAVPKTGSTAIQKRLCEVDPELLLNHILGEDGEWRHMPTHSTALAIRQVLGERAKEYTFVAFLRDPCDVVRSKYHFYRSGRAASIHGPLKLFQPDGTRFKPMTALKVLSAKMLPLSIWARSYPFKSSAAFVTNETGEVVVDKIGSFDRLQEDFRAIFTDFGYTDAQLELGIANETQYDRSREDMASVRAIVARRLPEDFALLEKSVAYQVSPKRQF